MAGLLTVISCSDKEKSALTKLDASTPYQFTVEDYIEAASLGQLESVKDFLAAGMNVDAEDAEGRHRPAPGRS